MNAIEERIIKLLSTSPLDRHDLVKKFPIKQRTPANAALTALILSEKVGLRNGLYFPLSKPSKMHNKKVVIDGLKFDSIKEGERYKELKILLRALKIKDLVPQPRFKIVDRVAEYKGKSLAARFYVADFKYTEDGVTVVEDVKSEHTIKDPVYTLKRQLFLLNYPDIDFREIL